VCRRQPEIDLGCVNKHHPYPIRSRVAGCDARLRQRQGRRVRRCAGARQQQQLGAVRLDSEHTAVNFWLERDLPVPCSVSRLNNRVPPYIRTDRLATVCRDSRIPPELFADAFRGIQYHIQHFIRFGQHRNVTAL